MAEGNIAYAGWVREVASGTTALKEEKTTGGSTAAAGHTPRLEVKKETSVFTDDQKKFLKELAKHEMPSDDEYAAKIQMMKEGLVAVFGENYPDPVRVVAVGLGEDTLDDVRADPSTAKWRAASIELCGGTHSLASGDAQRSPRALSLLQW